MNFKNISTWILKIVIWGIITFLILLILLFTLSSINVPKGFRLVSLENTYGRYNEDDLVFLFKDDAYGKDKYILYEDAGDQKISQIDNFDVDNDEIIYIVKDQDNTALRLENSDIKGEVKMKLPGIGKHLSFLDSVQGVLSLLGMTLFLLIVLEYEYFLTLIRKIIRKDIFDDRKQKKDKSKRKSKKLGSEKKNKSSVQFMVKDISKGVRATFVGNKKSRNIDSVVIRKK